MKIEPKKGVAFTHARQLREVVGTPVKDWPHATCTITRVTRDRVYFRNETGYLAYVGRDEFDAAVFDGGWYLTVRNGRRKGVLLGPFATNTEADEWLPKLQQAALDNDGFAWGYEWSTELYAASGTGNLPRGTFNHRLGIAA